MGREAWQVSYSPWGRKVLDLTKQLIPSLIVFLKCVYFCLHLVFIAVYGLCLVVERRGYSLVTVFWLLIVMASFVVEHRF